MEASRIGNDTIVNSLIELGAQVDLQDNDGRSALMDASRSGNDVTVNILLACEAKSNMKDKNGETSLMMACRYGYDSVVTVLLENTVAIIDLKNNEDWSALMLASWNCHKECVKILLKHGASVERRFLKTWLFSPRCVEILDIIEWELGKFVLRIMVMYTIMSVLGRILKYIQ